MRQKGAELVENSQSMLTSVAPSCTRIFVGLDNVITGEYATLEVCMIRFVTVK